MKKTLSYLLTIIIILTSFPLVFASLVQPGDVDGDGKISAADARLALRGAVGLEDWANDTESYAYIASDVNFDGLVKADDARLILRVAVGLEQLAPREEETTLPEETTTDREVTTEEPSGDTDPTEETTTVVTDEPTSEETTSAPVQEVTTEPVTIPEETTTEEPTTEETTTEEPTTIPFDFSAGEFNEKVNVLKEKQGSYSVAHFRKMTSYCGDPVYGDGLVSKGIKAAFEKDATELKKPETEFSQLEKRAVMNSTFFVKNQPFVSSIKQPDIYSADISDTAGRIFKGTLTDAYTADNGVDYDISEYTNRNFGKVEKYTVVLKSQSASSAGADKSYSRIYTDVYNDIYNKKLSDFDDLKTYSDKIKTECSMTINTTVTYYFDKITGQPLAAQYDINTVINFKFSVTGLFGGSFSMPVYCNMTEYCFFDKY